MWGDDLSGAHQYLSGLACRRRPRASRYQTSGSRPVRGDLVKSASTRRPAHPHTRGTGSFAEIPDVRPTPRASRCQSILDAGRHRTFGVGPMDIWASGQSIFGRRVSGQSNIRRRTCRVNQYLGVGCRVSQIFRRLAAATGPPLPPPSPLFSPPPRSPPSLPPPPPPRGEKIWRCRDEAEVSGSVHLALGVGCRGPCADGCRVSEETVQASHQ